MRRRAAAAVAAAAVLMAAGCSDAKKGSAAGPTTAPAAATTIAAPAAGGVAPSVATTAIAGASLTPTTSPGGTVAPQATTTIPLAPGSTDPPASAPSLAPAPGSAAPPTVAPGPTSPPVTDIVDGDPDTFCPAVDRAVPLYYVMSLGGLNGPAAAAAYEVAVAPALSGPLSDAAGSAPSVVAPPFQRWAARTAQAVAAFKAAGATDAQVASFGQSYAAQIEAVTDAGGAQTPPDPVEAAVSIGIDRNRLTTAANSFVQANGTFESFAATLSQDVTLTPAAQQKLERLYPCAADLTNFTG